MRLKRWIAGAAAAVLCAVSCGCARTSPYGQGFRLPLTSEPLQLDPQIATDRASVTVLRSLMEGLTRLDETDVPVAAQAERWETSEDGKVYTFFLRDSAWQSGEAITAADYVYAWRRAVSPATHSSLGSEFLGIRGAADILAGKASADTLGVTAVDAHTLRVELIEEDPAFLSTVAGTAFFPCSQTFFESTGGRYGLEKEYTAANGAFTLTSWSHGEYLILDKNERYVAANEVFPSRVRYVVSEEDDPVNALKKGSLDAAELTGEQAAQAQASGLTVTAVSDRTYALWFNTDVDALQDAAVRHALRAGLAWETLERELTTLGYTLADGFVTPAAEIDGESYRRSENALSFRADDTSSAALDTETLSSLTLLCADDADALRLAQYVVQSWQKYLDVYVRLTPLSAAELEARVSVGNYQLALYTQIGVGTAASDAIASFGSDAARGNLSCLSDAAFDAALAEAARDGFTRDELEALEQRLYTLCPCVPLAFVSRYFGVSAGVEGLCVYPFNGGAHGVTFEIRSATRDE